MNCWHREWKHHYLQMMQMLGLPQNIAKFFSLCSSNFLSCMNGIIWAGFNSLTPPDQSSKTEVLSFMPVYTRDFHSCFFFLVGFFLFHCGKGNFGQTNFSIPREFLKLFDWKTSWIILLLDLRDLLHYEKSC